MCSSDLASMGPIVDRSREFLSATDVAVVKTRRALLDALTAYEEGQLPPGSALRPERIVVPDPVGGRLRVTASRP